MARPSSHIVFRLAPESCSRSQASGIDGQIRKEGEIIESCTILTTTPNSLLSDLHDRMPVILTTADYELWLDPAFKNIASVSEMLKPFDFALMRCYPVST